MRPVFSWRSVAMDSRWSLQTWCGAANCTFLLNLQFNILIMYHSAKYPLACVEKLLDVFGEDLGGGFDIGCKFKETLAKSPLGRRARELRHTCLVGSFHGHAHNRLCQLQHLAVYVKGLGLEDLEGCECAFSKSNALAASLRYASIFHRMQAIATYFEHNDTFEVYQNLSKHALARHVPRALIISFA
jgi:hypothetical protein